MTNIIMPNMCKILAFYNIVSDACPNDNVKIVANADTIKSANASTSSPSWLKILLIVIGSIVGIFVILVIIFAIRAKMNQQEEGTETLPEA
ncbi:MAG: hypothetical protein WCL02_05965 [bacterium]